MLPICYNEYLSHDSRSLTWFFFRPSNQPSRVRTMPFPSRNTLLIWLMHSGLIAWLFTFIPLFVITLGTGMIKNRNKKKVVKSSPWDRLPMEWFSYIMLVLHAAYTLSLLRNFKTFGSTPGCNKAARVFLFGTHKLTNSWFLGWTVAYAIILSGMFFLIFKTLFPMVSRKPITKPEEEQKAATKPQGNPTEESVRSPFSLSTEPSPFLKSSRPHQKQTYWPTICGDFPHLLWWSSGSHLRRSRWSSTTSRPPMVPSGSSDRWDSTFGDLIKWMINEGFI